MSSLIRLIVFVISAFSFDISHVAIAQRISDLKIRNPLAQRIIKNLDGKTRFDAWTVNADHLGKNLYVMAATASLPASASNKPALLGVNCIHKVPSISLIFDKNSHQFNEPIPILITLDNRLPQQEIAMPITGRDAIGIFGVRALFTVYMMHSANIITISFPKIGESWRFSLLGLAEAIAYMESPCGFSAQHFIEDGEMGQVQFRLRQLGYNAPTNGIIDKKMKDVILQIQKEYGLKKTGQIDDATYDVILQMISE